MENAINKEDKEKFIEFLNFVASKAKFAMNTKEVIHYFRLLNYMQQTLLPKLEANRLEVVAVHETKEVE